MGRPQNLGLEATDFSIEDRLTAKRRHEVAKILRAQLSAASVTISENGRVLVSTPHTAVPEQEIRDRLAELGLTFIGGSYENTADVW